MDVEVLEKGSKIAFKASVKNIYDSELLVEFEHNWQPPKRVPFSECRLPPAPNTRELKGGDEVEVFSQASHDEGHAWWPAKIKMVKGGFFVVDYTGWQKTYSDIVVDKRVRHPNKNPPVTSSTFQKYMILIPDDLDSVSKIKDIHKDFRKALQNATVLYNQAVKNLVVWATDSATIKKAIILTDFHLKYLKQKSAVLKKAKGAEHQWKKANATKVQTSGFREQFTVKQSLMGLAIGTKGSNIKAAQGLPGIITISVDRDTCTFTVVAENEEALAEARSKLEFVDEVLKIPSKFAGRVIGRNGCNIQDIVDKSGGLRIRLDEDSQEEGMVDLVSIGTKECVQNALEMFQLQLNHWLELEKIIDEKSKEDDQLRSFAADTTINLTSHGGLKKYQSESDLTTMTKQVRRRRPRRNRRVKSDNDHETHADTSNATTTVVPEMDTVKSKQQEENEGEQKAPDDNDSCAPSQAKGHQQTKTEMPQVLIAPIPNPAMCPGHAGELLRIYCMTCCKLICVSCWEKDHDDHETSTAMKRIELLRTEVATLMFDLQTTAEEQKQQQTSLSDSVNTKRQSFATELQSRKKQQTAAVGQLEMDYRKVLDKAERSFKKKKEDLVQAMTQTYKDKMESEIKILQDASDKLKVECIDLDTTVSKYQTRLKTVAGAALLTPSTPTTQTQAEIQSDCSNLTLDDVAALLPQLQRDVATPRTAPPVVASEPTALHVPEHLKHFKASDIH